jgi:L-iditol 2-dehydrogenase
MKAVEFLGNERLEIRERPDPEPGPNDLLIAPRAVGICGTDIEVFEGSLVYFRTGLARYPIVPGHEWVGEVLHTGSEVTTFKPGDQVVGECPIGCGHCSRCRAGAYHLCAQRTEVGILNRDGAMATRLVYPAKAAHRLDDRIDPRAGALIEPTAVALNGARRGDVDQKTVLVVGAGPIGLLSAQCARAEGASRTILADTRDDRLEFAHRHLGLEAHIQAAPDPRDTLEAIRATYDEDAIDVVILCAGGASATALALQAVRPGGTVVMLGLAGKPTVAADLDSVVVRDLSLRGVLSSPGMWPDAIELVASGAVRLDPLISAAYALEDAREALENLTAPGAMKVLIEPR